MSPDNDPVVVDTSSMHTTSTPGVPFWALPLVQQVSEIRALAQVIPKLERDLDDLRGKTVPLPEHNRLMEQVGKLWDQSNKLMPQLEEKLPQIDKMWEERSENRGAIRALKWGVATVAFFQGILMLIAVAYQAGMRIHFGGN